MINRGTPIAGWFIREHHFNMDDLGTPISGNLHISYYYLIMQGLVSMSQCFTSPNKKGDISSPTARTVLVMGNKSPQKDVYQPF